MVEFKSWKTSFIKEMKLLIFDCDGTLIDTLRSHYLTWKESYERKGTSFVSEDDFRENLAGISNSETVTLLNNRFGYTFSPTEISSFKEENFALKNAGVPVEMHLYAEGGHAFGLRRTKHPITMWPQLVETWLDTIGMISH